MARPIVIKDVKARIKDNKQVMKVNKQTVTTYLKDQSQFEPKDVRAALANFIKASKSVYDDNQKLEAVKNG